MRLRAVCLSLLVAVIVSAAPSVAADGRFGVGIKAGTYGFGADFGVTLNRIVAFRVSLSGANPSLTEAYDDIEYNGDLTLGGFGALADIYPFGGQFRFTGGLFANRNELTLAGTPTEPVQIGDDIYTPDEIGTMSGSIKFDSTAPYLGLGWGNTSRGKKMLRFVVDVGVLFQGSGQIEDLNSSIGLVSEEDLAREAQVIEDEIADYKYWPVISAGLAFRF
jgi:hypothetical protein